MLDLSLVVVGCSAGGLAAARLVLSGLDPDTNASVVVAQHRAPGPSSLVVALASRSPWPVSEPDDKERIEPRRIYVAPPDYHLLVEGDHFELSTDAPVRNSRPSIDLTFSSASTSFRDRLVAVVLTGANTDGADGAREAAGRGAKVVVQDPSSAFAPAMPQATLDRLDSSTSALVLPIEEIGQALGRLLGEPRRQTASP